MPYKPKTALAYLQEMSARLIARTKLTDLNEGSVLTQLLGAVAEELAANDYRAKKIRESFYLTGVSGTDLERRIAELPLGGIVRKPSIKASGSVLTLVRNNNAEEGEAAYPDTLVITAGSQVARGDDPSVIYEISVDVGFDVGESTKTDIHVRCTKPGSDGNCAADTITEIVSLHEDIISVTNQKGLSNGRGAERDSELRSRAIQFLSSLARCQPVALEHFCTSFVDPESGVQLVFAKIFEDPDRRGYCEVYVDDGGGLDGLTEPGQTSEQIVPAAGPQAVLFHRAPATAPIPKITVTKAGGGVEILKHSNKDYVSLHERGIVYVNPGKIAAGDTWKIEGADYTTYAAPIKNLQAEIEGDTSNPYFHHGFRAAGTRIVVKPAITNLVKFKINLLVVPYADFVDVAAQLKDDLVSFMSKLHPGQTLYIAQLIDALMSAPRITSLRIFDPVTDKFMDDQPVASPYEVLRTNLELIEIIPAVDE